MGQLLVYNVIDKIPRASFSQCGRRWGQWSEVKEWRMGKERRPTWGWEVWLAVWAGAVISLIAILLYCLVLDIDTPDIKPRYEYWTSVNLQVSEISTCACKTVSVSFSLLI